MFVCLVSYILNIHFVQDTFSFLACCFLLHRLKEKRNLSASVCEIEDGAKEKIQTEV